MIASYIASGLRCFKFYAKAEGLCCALVNKKYQTVNGQTEGPLSSSANFAPRETPDRLDERV